MQAVVVVPADPFDDGELELGAGLPDGSRISSVLKLSTKLSAIALSYASPIEPSDPRTSWS